jgi:hypothetical protein
MRRRNLLAVAAIVVAASVAGPAARAWDEKKTEKRQEEKLKKLTEELARRQSAAQPSELVRFLNARAAVLLDRARQSRSDNYVFERLVSAADDLLEAVEDVVEAASESETIPKEKNETARRLERYYFRVQQGDYFAARSGEADAAVWVKHARSLYQQAREAYDAGQFKRARRLGDAADSIVDALESLAQAKVRVPEPPRLP